MPSKGSSPPLSARSGGDPAWGDLSGDILIVDDTPDNLRLLSALLARYRISVRKALSGAWAIAAAQAAPPDLILLDIKMPEMDGYTVCQQLRADPRTAAVPVIFISALDDAADKVNAFAAGGADYITKPFQEAEVMARIAHQLRLQRLQAQLVAQNQELARSNQDLAQFAAVVAHDLQQPLQSMVGYAKLMPLVDPTMHRSPARPYLDNLVAAGDRMQQLIQNWLAYAQVGQGPPPLDTVDANALIAQAVFNLKGPIAASQAEIDCDDLPLVLGNELLLLQLWQNLIGNAIKFATPGTPPQITISVQPQEPGWRFGIHDNGIGIAPEHQAHIFEAFHRLHDPQTYPGSGLGLAICQKIVASHGGRLWVKSQPGRGSSFYFTLRAAIAPPCAPGDPDVP